MGDMVLVNGMAPVHAGRSARGIAMPDVCLCPPGPPAGPTRLPLTNSFKAAGVTCGAPTRPSPAGRTAQAAVYFYVDRQPPAVVPMPAPE